ncbi:glycosyltransferase [Rhizobium sp. TRM95111]|uniref:glycosyltransferase family 2 protein n=1 Tax=Rhizobium alarense TaxID=2846851 RepID=UPI001F2B338B|nr:glycosyltransferase family 2 protein [Rhizobium alarense]MCF3642087.1 glycosyltransferase [Rhizobium alarense]
MDNGNGASTLNIEQPAICYFCGPGDIAHMMVSVRSVLQNEDGSRNLTFIVAHRGLEDGDIDVVSDFFRAFGNVGFQLLDCGATAFIGDGFDALAALIPWHQAYMLTPLLFPDRKDILVLSPASVSCRPLSALTEPCSAYGAPLIEGFVDARMVERCHGGAEIEHDGRSLTLASYMDDVLEGVAAESYIGSDCLLWHLADLREQGNWYAGRLEAALKKDLVFASDTLNFVFGQRTLAWAEDRGTLLAFDDEGEAVSVRAENTVVLIAYRNNVGPWNRPGLGLSSRFWYWAKQTPRYMVLLSEFKSAIGFTEIHRSETVLAETVSVVVPAYNAGPHLAACLASILVQEVDVEIIVVDPSSTDDTSHTLALFEAAFACVRAIRLPERTWSGEARNAGLRHAAGNFVAFLDADDVYATPHSLRTLVASCIEHDADMAYGRIGTLRPDGTTLDKADIENPDRAGLVTIDDSTATHTPLHHHRYIFRKSFLDRKQLSYPNHRRGQDLVFLARCLTSVDRLASVPELVHLHRLGRGGRRFSYEDVRDLIHAFADVAHIFTQAGRAQYAFISIRARLAMLLGNIMSLEKTEDKIYLIGKLRGLKSVFGLSIPEITSLDQQHASNIATFEMQLFFGASDREIVDAYQQFPGQFPPLGQQEKLQSRAKRIAGLTTKVEHRGAEIVRLRQNAGKFKEEIARLTEKCDLSKAEAEGLRRQATLLKKDLEAARRRVETLESLPSYRLGRFLVKIVRRVSLAVRRKTSLGRD